MSYGIKIFGKTGNRVLDSNYLSYRLLYRETSVDLNNTFTVNSIYPPLVFVAARDGVCMQPPKYRKLSGTTWEITTERYALRTEPWDVSSTLAPVTWSQIPLTSPASVVFNNTSNLTLTLPEHYGDIYIFGVFTDSMGGFGAAMFSAEDPTNPFILANDPLVVVKHLNLDPRPWTYSPGTSKPDYGPNNTNSYLDYSKVESNGNYSKVALLPTTVTNPAICTGTFTFVGTDSKWSDIFVGVVYRFFNGQFIAGSASSGVCTVGRLVTTWTGNFWKGAVETSSNNQSILSNFVSVLVIDTDMY